MTAFAGGAITVVTHEKATITNATNASRLAFNTTNPLNKPYNTDTAKWINHAMTKAGMAFQPPNF